MNAPRGLGWVLLFLGLIGSWARGAELAWVELSTSGVPSDLAGFYENTLGWTSARTGTGALDPVVFSRGGRPVAGLTHRAGERMGPVRSRWIGYWAAADLVAAEQTAVEAGGRVIAGGAAKTAPGERQALLADAEGAVFGLVSAAGAERAKGFWPVWLGRDTRAGAEFYRKTLGGEIRAEGRTPLFAGDFLLVNEGRAWAGVQPTGVGGGAGWLVLFAVADLDAALARARKQGARVLRAPTIDLIGGRVAVLADTAGGVFGLCEALPVDARRPVKAAGGGAPVKVGDYEVETLSK